jgi:hypothetical protein
MRKQWLSVLASIRIPSLVAMRHIIPLSLSCLLEGLLLVHYTTYTPACNNDLLLNVPAECVNSPIIDRMT